MATLNMKSLRGAKSEPLYVALFSTDSRFKSVFAMQEYIRLLCTYSCAAGFL